MRKYIVIFPRQKKAVESGNFPHTSVSVAFSAETLVFFAKNFSVFTPPRTKIFGFYQLRAEN
jgi:hypothetical protein